jgi:hypothetical protein
VCTTLTTTSVPAPGKFRLASGGGAWARSGGVIECSIMSKGCRAGHYRVEWRLSEEDYVGRG